jgi:hypothetical protein
MTNEYAEQDPAYKDLLIWFQYVSLKSGTRVFILENPPPPPGEGKYQLMSFGGKNMKRRREKGGKCKRKRKKGEKN